MRNWIILVYFFEFQWKMTNITTIAHFPSPSLRIANRDDAIDSTHLHTFLCASNPTSYRRLPILKVQCPIRVQNHETHVSLFCDILLKITTYHLMYTSHRSEKIIFPLELLINGHIPHTDCFFDLSTH